MFKFYRMLVVHDSPTEPSLSCREPAPHPSSEGLHETLAIAIQNPTQRFLTESEAGTLLS